MQRENTEIMSATLKLLSAWQKATDGWDDRRETIEKLGCDDLSRFEQELLTEWASEASDLCEEASGMLLELLIKAAQMDEEYSLN
ncbi:MAG: hypothetical protein AAGA12_09735 [Pseudomonadota bacterium]